jgi:hypothetical protein
MFCIFKKRKQAYRTLQIYGDILDEPAGTVAVNNQIVHSGPFKSNLLFEFITNVKVNNTVKIDIEIISGSIIINKIRARYPALINGQYKGFVDIPQPINQPLVGIELPLTIKSNTTYRHYMVNGPMQWLTESKTNKKVVVIDDFNHAIATGIIRPDWG